MDKDDNGWCPRLIEQREKALSDFWKRIEKALASERFQVPPGLTREEIREFILSKSKGDLAGNLSRSR